MSRARRRLGRAGRIDDEELPCYSTIQLFLPSHATIRGEAIDGPA